MIFYNFVNYLEIIDEYLDEINVERIQKIYIRNLEDPFEKYNDDNFFFKKNVFNSL